MNKNWKIALRVVANCLFALCATALCSAQTWERIGPEGGNVISLATASDNTVYLGAADGHIFASSFSQNPTPHWELRGRAGSRLDGVVQQLLVDERDPNRLFAAVWYQDPAAGGGVFRSDDSARTWYPAGLGGEAVRALEQSGSQPEILVAGTRTGIFRSNDHGANWQRISPAGDAELKNIDSLAIDPANPLVIYAGTYHLPWKTTDGGKTWAPIAAGMIDDSDVMTLRIDAANATRIFASACSGIYRSENAAANWTKLQGIPYSSRRTQAIVQDRRDPRVLYAGTTEGLWVTRDAGETWMRTTPREWIVNAIALVPGGSNQSTLLLGTEGQGILVSNDAGVHFSAANTGFSHHVVAALVGDSHDSQHFLAHMDNPESTLLESHDSGKSWLPLTENRLASIEKLFATDSGWWASVNGGGLLHYDATERKWLRFRFVSFAPPTRHKTNATQHSPGAQSGIIVQKDPELLDVQSSGTSVYVATSNGIWSGELGKHTLYGPAPNTAKEAFHSLAISESANQLWAVTNENLLYSNDAAKTWTLDNLHALSSSPILSIRALATLDDTSLLLATHHGVYKRSTTPDSAWQLLQNGLPAAEPTAIFSNAKFLVVAMRNGGIYLSRDSGKTWERLDTSREQSIFTSIVPDGHDGFFAASLSEGILHWSPGSSTNP